jgi:hypothetical protein
VINRLINFETITSDNHDWISLLKIYPLFDIEGNIKCYLSDNPLLSGMEFKYTSEVLPGKVTHIISRIK